jgi:acetolactate synthase I/II/III large subunit
VMGDSAIGMVAMDIETAVRNKIGIVTVIFNNGIMAIESASLVKAHEQYGANFQGGNYADVARALGAHGERVEKPDAFGPALAKALAAAGRGQPAVIECIVKAGYVWPGRGEPRA